MKDAGSIGIGEGSYRAKGRSPILLFSKFGFLVYNFKTMDYGSDT